MKPLFQTALLLAFICTLCGCKVDKKQGGVENPSQPLYLELINSDVGTLAVSVSPFDGSRDTLVIDSPLTNLVVMSTSHFGFLDALDAIDCISGISGLNFIYTARSEGYSGSDESNMSSGLASPDRSHPRLVRGRGPDRWREWEDLSSQSLREMGGAERSEESGLSEPVSDGPNSATIRS